MATFNGARRARYRAAHWTPEPAASRHAHTIQGVSVVSTVPGQFTEGATVRWDQRSRIHHATSWDPSLVRSTHAHSVHSYLAVSDARLEPSARGVLLRGFKLRAATAPGRYAGATRAYGTTIYEVEVDDYEVSTILQALGIDVQETV